MAPRPTYTHVLRKSLMHPRPISCSGQYATLGGSETIPSKFSGIRDCKWPSIASSMNCSGGEWEAYCYCPAPFDHHCGGKMWGLVPPSPSDTTKHYAIISRTALPALFNASLGFVGPLTDVHFHQPPSILVWCYSSQSISQPAKYVPPHPGQQHKQTKLQKL